MEQDEAMFYKSHTQVMSIRPKLGSASVLKAEGEKSRSNFPMHPAHLSTILTVTDLPPKKAVTVLPQMGLRFGLAVAPGKESNNRNEAAAIKSVSLSVPPHASSPVL